MTSVLKNNFNIRKSNVYVTISPSISKFDVYGGVLLDSPTGSNGIDKATTVNYGSYPTNNNSFNNIKRRNDTNNNNGNIKNNDISNNVSAIVSSVEAAVDDNSSRSPKMKYSIKLASMAPIETVDSSKRKESESEDQDDTDTVTRKVVDFTKFNELPFEQHYDVGERLGSGQFAFVHRVIRRTDGEIFAAKFIRKRRYATSRRGVPRSHIQREVNVLRTVGGHDNIVQLHDVFETVNDVILVLELISGGELFDHVCAKESLNEAEAATFIRQILYGVQHLHANFVVHLDLKPENIMLKKRGEPYIKLVDFGLSRQIFPGISVKDMIGTPEFVAPEIVNYEPLSSATDMWSLGIVAYILLSGGSPFIGRTRDETFWNISSVKYQFSHNYFGNTSNEAKDFISRLLVRDPRRRPSARECLSHTWIRRHYFGEPVPLTITCEIPINEKSDEIRRRWKKSVEIIRFCNKIIQKKSSKQIVRPTVSIKSRTFKKTKYASEKLTAVIVEKMPAIIRVDERMCDENGSSEHIQLQFADNIVASAIFVACEEGDLAALEQLNDSYAIDLFNIENELGETPLHVGAGAGFERLVAYLLRHGADARRADNAGDTPLAWAARNGHAQLVRMLLIGCAPSISAGPAAGGGRKSPLKAKASLSEKIFNDTCDVNAANKAGETALHIATRYAQVECTLALLENGANPNIQDEHGETALHIASWHGYTLLLSILCSFGPNHSLFNMDDETALHCAATRGHIECVQSLVENGASIDLQDEFRQTPLHLALKRSYVDVALFLITKGCSLDAQDQDGDTPLHIASRLGLSTIVQTLCHLGAKLDVQNAQSLTPLHIAARECRPEVARCLCLAGCNCSIKTKDGLTAEIISFAHKNSEIGSLLAKVKSDQAREQYVQQLCHLPTPLRRIKLKLFGHSNVGKSTLVHALQQTPSTSSSADALYGGAATTLSGGNGTHTAMRPLNSIVDAVSRRLSDNLLMSSVHAHWNGAGGATSQSHPTISNVQTFERSNNSAHTASMGGSTKRVSNNESNETSVGMASCYASTTCSTASSASADSGVDSDATYGRRYPKDDSTLRENSYPLNYEPAIHNNYTCGIDVQNVNFPNCGEFSIWEFGGYEPYHIAYDHFVGNTDCIHIIVIRATDPTEVQYKQVLYWMNFLKGRVTPSEPIGHCGIVSRRSKVIVIGTCATPDLFGRPTSARDNTVATIDEPLLLANSDADAMMKTVKLRFETHFDIHDRILFLDSQQLNCGGMRALRRYLQEARDTIVDRLQRPLLLLDVCVAFLAQLRKRYANFPMVTWPHFTNVIRNEINPLSTDAHCRQLVQQLQLVGEVVYLRDETSELDYVVLTPEWLGTHVIGRILSAKFLEQCPRSGCYSAADFSAIFQEIVEPSDLLRILDTLQLCTLIDDPTTAAVAADAGFYEFPAFISAEPPANAWTPLVASYVYGGMRIVPQRGMEKSLQSTFPRIQVSMRRSMRDFQDPMDAELQQWRGVSKMCSGQMQALIRLVGDAVEIQVHNLLNKLWDQCIIERVRGPMETASSCIYFLEDIANLVEQTAGEVAPGICIERHFLSPRHLKEHLAHPASFPPEVIMMMQQRESLEIRNTDGETELFTDVVCFGSRESAAALTLGVDVSVSQLPLASRCELAALLDPPDSMGRDWSILAVKLNLADQLPEVDSTGQSLSRTDQLLAEWALQCPEQASIGRLCSILEELGREDARDVLYRTMPLYLFAPLEDGGAPPVLNSTPDPSEPD